MKHLALVGFLALSLASCATDYQPQGFTGGYSDYLTAPDEAVITFHGNGYTAPERVGQMAALRCAEVTLEHSYRYFIIIGASDLSGTTSFTTPGYAHTYGSAFATGNFATGTATTTYTPPQTYRFFKPGVILTIKMSNNEKSLGALRIVRVRPPHTTKRCGILEPVFEAISRHQILENVSTTR